MDMDMVMINVVIYNKRINGFLGPLLAPGRELELSSSMSKGCVCSNSSSASERALLGGDTPPSVVAVWGLSTWTPPSDNAL